MSYKLAVCLGDNGVPIKDYIFPAASDSIYVDPLTGDLIWQNPVELGKYNVAIAIEEWRDGIKIGEIIRDMQIEVHPTDNYPPEIERIDDICVEKGRLIAGPFESAINSYWTIIILPDGSKEGWPQSESGDDFRRKAIRVFDQFGVDWAEIQYGDENDENKMLRHSGSAKPEGETQ